MFEFLNDPAVLGAIGVLIGAVGGYFLMKAKFGFVEKEVAAKAIVSVLKAIEAQTAEGTPLDTLLDNLIPELDKRFGEKKTDVIVAKVEDALGEA